MKLAADENFNNDILRGLLRRKSDVVIEDLLLLIECSAEDEWEGQVCYVPLH